MIACPLDMIISDHKITIFDYAQGNKKLMFDDSNHQTRCSMILDTEPSLLILSVNLHKEPSLDKKDFVTRAVNLPACVEIDLNLRWLGIAKAPNLARALLIGITSCLAFQKQLVIGIKISF